MLILLRRQPSWLALAPTEAFRATCFQARGAMSRLVVATQLTWFFGKLAITSKLGKILKRAKANEPKNIKSMIGVRWFETVDSFGCNRNNLLLELALFSLAHMQIMNYQDSACINSWK